MLIRLLNTRMPRALLRLIIRRLIIRWLVNASTSGFQVVQSLLLKRLGA